MHAVVRANREDAALQQVLLGQLPLHIRDRIALNINRIDASRRTYMMSQEQRIKAVAGRRIYGNGAFAKYMGNAILSFHGKVHVIVFGSSLSEQEVQHPAWSQ